MLDGVEKLDNVVLIATNQLPRKLEARVIKRPSFYQSDRFGHGLIWL
jgi:hypothetical protein